MTEQTYRPYTNSEIQRIVRMRMAGWHPEDIAKITGRTESTINRLLCVEKKKHNHQYPKQYKGTKWTDQRIEQLAKEYRPRVDTYQSLGKKHNISAPRVGALFAKRAEGLHNGTWMG